MIAGPLISRVTYRGIQRASGTLGLASSRHLSMPSHEAAQWLLLRGQITADPSPGDRRHGRAWLSIEARAGGGTHEKRGRGRTCGSGALEWNRIGWMREEIGVHLICHTV